MVPAYYAFRIGLVGLFLFSIPIGYIISRYKRYDDLWMKIRQAQIVDKFFDSGGGRLKYCFIIMVEDIKTDSSDQCEYFVSKDQYNQAVIGEYIDNPFYEDMG